MMYPIYDVPMPTWMPDPKNIAEITNYYLSPHPWEWPVFHSHGNTAQPFRCPYDGSIMAITVWADYAGGYSSPEPAYAAYCLLCNCEADL